MQIESLATLELGNRSYVVHDGTHALLVDPPRDVARVEAVLERLGVDVAAVLETHIHNDYVTGGFHLAGALRVPYLVSADEPVQFQREGVRDGDVLEFGGLAVSVLATPGHTDHHLAYVVAGEAGSPAALFTGGSLLYGNVGRTDLVDPARAHELARAQFRSARRLGELPGTTQVFPTHGFGSFCSAGATVACDHSSLADQLVANPVFSSPSEEEFATRLVAGLDLYPSYYAHMAPANLAGPSAPPQERPAKLTPAQVHGRVAAGEWVVDLRKRAEYAAAHLPGTAGFEFAPSLATYLGWCVPWQAPLTLLGVDDEQLVEARRMLSLIGIDTFDEGLVGDLDPADLTGSYRRAAFADLAEALAAPDADLVLLDTRNPHEHAAAHLPGAVNIPLGQLVDRLDELPTDRDIWVYCAAGYRASIASSLVNRSGRTVVHIDESFDHAPAAGFPLRGTAVPA